MNRLRVHGRTLLCLSLCALPAAVRSSRPDDGRVEIGRILDRVVTLASHPEPWKSDRAALGQVAVLQAKIGDLAAARKIAAAIPDEDKMVKTGVLSALAEAEVRAGLKAEQTFARARTVAEARTSGSNNPDWIADVFRPIAEARLRVRDVEGAVRLLKTREAGFSRDMAVYQIVDSRLEAGDIEGAHKLAAAMPLDDRVKAACLEAIASKQADSGDLEGARMTVASVDAKFRPFRAEASIAALLARRGEMKTARQIADGLDTYPGYGSKFSALAGIARAQYRAGDRQGTARTLGELRALAERTRDDSWRADAFMEVGKACALAGDRAGAERSYQKAFEADDRYHKTLAAERAGQGYPADSHEEWMLLKIAKTQVRTGDFAGALKTISRLKYKGSGNGVVHEIALKRAQNEPVKPLIAWAESRMSREEKNQALTGIAEGLFGKLKPGANPKQP